MKHVAAVLLVCAAVFAADKAPLPKDLPPYGQMKPFVPPKVLQEKLPNGLTLWLAPVSGFPKIAVTIAIRGGMAADPPNRPGLAEFLQATVGQGTKTRTARQVAEEMQAAGGDLAIAARPDVVRISTSVLASKIEPALAVLADVVQNATFPNDEVEIARRNLADSLRAQEAEPRFLANRALAKAIFGDHPYSIVAPTQESIAATTADELRRQYAARFHPSQALLVAVGDFDAASMRSLCARLIGQWAGAPAAAVNVPAPPQETPHAIFTVARRGSVQTTLVVGSLGPLRSDPQFATAEVANAIFGGAFNSRLVQNIREDKGYTYSPGAYFDVRRRADLYHTQADVRNEVTGASFNEITYELNRMATTAPTVDEVAEAQRFLMGNKAISLQGRESVASQLANLWANDLPPEELGAESERIRKTTPADVAAVGRKYYPAARATIIAVGDAEVISGQLGPFGIQLRAVSGPAAAARTTSK